MQTFTKARGYVKGYLAHCVGALDIHESAKPSGTSNLDGCESRTEGMDAACETVSYVTTNYTQIDRISSRRNRKQVTFI